MFGSLNQSVSPCLRSSLLRPPFLATVNKEKKVPTHNFGVFSYDIFSPFLTKQLRQLHQDCRSTSSNSGFNSERKTLGSSWLTIN